MTATATRIRRRLGADDQVHAPRTEIRFADGLVVDVCDCPSAIPARSHWSDRGDGRGVCSCPAGTPHRKWSR